MNNIYKIDMILYAFCFVRLFYIILCFSFGDCASNDSYHAEYDTKYPSE